VESACSLLEAYGDEARILAGGSELMLLLKMGVTQPAHVIDIKRIAGLDGLAIDDQTGALHIGALVRHRSLETSPLVASHFPLIVEMEQRLANVRIRNVGTLAGNLCFAEPHADPGTLLLAYGARLKLHGAAGERTLPIANFFLDYYTTAVQPTELLTQVEIPGLEGYRGAYLRFCPAERPMVTAALLVKWREDRCEDVRIALGCVAPQPFRLDEDLKGKTDREILSIGREIAERAAALCDPVEDIWGSKEYKKQIAKALVIEGLSRVCLGERSQ
jgi:carbon-monoxide dehydrogenase medium subunit